MGVEIERKYLVQSMDWIKQAGDGTRLVQGYLATTDKTAIRVRIAGSQAWLTLKSAKSGIRRLEFEYSLPVADAEQMLDQLCQGQVIHKTRYRLPVDGHVWEIDVFHGANEGLVLAEIELESEKESFILPDWLGQEVSGDKRYYNAYLSQTPFKSWPESRGN
jgi:CYTH domain-containing protein